MRRKCSVVIAVATLMLASTTGLASDAVNGTYQGFPIVKVVVDGVEIKSDVPAVNFHGKTMLPVRDIAEALGLQVGWDDTSWTATLTTEDQDESTYDDADEGGKATASGFEFNNVRFRQTAALGIVITGEVTNRTGKDYDDAIFAVILYDGDGDVLDTVPIITGYLSNGRTKSWQVFAPSVDEEDIDKYEFRLDMGF